MRKISPLMCNALMPPLKLTRYGRHCKPGLGTLRTILVRAWSTCAPRAAELER